MTARPNITPPPLVVIDQQSLMHIMQELAEIKIALARATITPAPEWVTVREAAKQLKVTPQTIRRKIDAGQIQAKGNGKLKRVRL